jgi:hypothetical protein
MVQAEELTRESILEAIRKGDFYATQGPRFESITIEDGKVIVKCSPVKDIVFYSNLVYHKDRCTRGEGVTYAESNINPQETYIRVELVDENGNCAWSSPIPLK